MKQDHVNLALHLSTGMNDTGMNIGEGTHRTDRCLGSLHSDDKVEWGSGDREKFKIAQVLRDARLESESVVFIDSFVTTALFGRSSKSRKIFQVQVLSKDAVDGRLDKEIQEDMKKIYEVYKQRLNLHEAALYMNITADLATKLWGKFQILREGGTKETLTWSVTNIPVDKNLLSNLSYTGSSKLILR